MLKKLKLKNSEAEQSSNASHYIFPRHATRIINLLNSNAQGTRPAFVGQKYDGVLSKTSTSLQFIIINNINNAEFSLKGR